MILHGDCAEKLKELEDNSVDAIITDPPYGLKFMGRSWDYDVPATHIWREALRVLKPGGYLLSFGGTRTYHRMVVNIEDAGFEIRDQIQWLYGSGFPKSHDVSKAIDKLHGAEREVVGVRADFAARANKKRIGQNFMDISVSDGSFSNPETVGQITAPSTPDAIKWQGFGTALKPANEPIVLARKPLSEKTIALNVLKWGCGGLNIDASRIEAKPRKTGTRLDGEEIDAKPTSFQGSNKRSLQAAFDLKDQGRFPANIILDEDAAAMLDQQASSQKLGRSGGNKAEKIISDEKSASNTFGKNSQIKPGINSYSDTGGASRFFYVAKASKSERNAGCEGMEPKFTATMNDGIGKREHNPDQPTAYNTNHHPTVKPIRLMEYLIRLITPPGGTVLDPFMGSGSTGVAAKRLGFDFIGIELNSDYVAIAEKRIEATP